MEYFYPIIEPAWKMAYRVGGMQLTQVASLTVLLSFYSLYIITGQSKHYKYLKLPLMS